MITPHHYIAFTSTFVLQNPGAGAWTAIIYDAKKDGKKSKYKFNDFAQSTTPNELELLAIIKTMESVKSQTKLTIIHDSSYLDNIISKWIFQWESRSFKNTQGKDISNVELIRRLSQLRKSKNVNFFYTGQRDKPIYNQMANFNSKLYLYSKLDKTDPINVLNSIIEENKPK